MTGLTTPLDQAQNRPQGTSRGCIPQPGPPCSPALQPDPFPFPDDCNSLLTGPWPWVPSTHHPPTLEFPHPDSLPMASTVELLPLRGSFNAPTPGLPAYILSLIPTFLSSPGHHPDVSALNLCSGDNRCGNLEDKQNENQEPRFKFEPCPLRPSLPQFLHLQKDMHTTRNVPLLG